MHQTTSKTLALTSHNGCSRSVHLPSLMYHLSFFCVLGLPSGPAATSLPLVTRQKSLEYNVISLHVSHIIPELTSIPRAAPWEHQNRWTRWLEMTHSQTQSELVWEDPFRTGCQWHKQDRISAKTAAAICSSSNTTKPVNNSTRQTVQLVTKHRWPIRIVGSYVRMSIELSLWFSLLCSIVDWHYKVLRYILHDACSQAAAFHPLLRKCDIFTVDRLHLEHGSDLVFIPWPVYWKCVRECRRQTSVTIALLCIACSSWHFLVR
jgi:hypothetical protein